jgi:hypothetical protein
VESSTTGAWEPVVRENARRFEKPSQIVSPLTALKWFNGKGRLEPASNIDPTLLAIGQMTVDSYVQSSSFVYINARFKGVTACKFNVDC